VKLKFQQCKEVGVTRRAVVQQVQIVANVTRSCMALFLAQAGRDYQLMSYVGPYLNKACGRKTEVNNLAYDQKRAGPADKTSVHAEPSSFIQHMEHYVWNLLSSATLIIADT
jgi:hypothetical protein